MSRHDDTPPTNRTISPNHPSVRGNQARMIAEIDNWLEQDEKERRKLERYRKFERYLAGTMLALIAILGTLLIVVNLFRLVIP